MIFVKKISKSCVLAVSIVLLLILKVVSPLVKCQLCVVGFHRYGHLVLEPEVFLAERRLKLRSEKRSQRIFNIWSFGPKKKQANTYLAKKWKQEVFALPSWLVSGLHSAGMFVDFLKLSEAKLSIRGQLNALDSSGPILTFSDKEKQRANQKLIELGIDPNRPYVCLIVRDGGHYASLGESESIGYDLLNFDIDTFMPSAGYLVSEGFQVIRMGSGSEKTISELPSGVIDYAHSPMRSEFLDVFIAATCTFAVSTQTGPDAVCMAFRRPVLYVDVTRYSQFFFGMKAATWTPVRLARNGKIIPFSEIISSDIPWYKDPNEFALNGITQLKSSPSELLQIAKSYVESFRGSAELTDRLSLQLAEKLGERGRQQFGQISARSIPGLAEILGDWVNN